MAINRQFPTLESLAYRVLLGNSQIDIRSTHIKMKEKIMRDFLQAVIDDKRAMVEQFLTKHPELLLIEPQAYSTSKFIIESQYTWQKFYAENALVMAVKRKQIEMIVLLLSFFDKLPQTKEHKQFKADALSAWLFYELQGDKKNKEIVIPLEYALYAQSLVDVFKEETFINGKLSEKTELALFQLFNMLLPNNAIRLDIYLDVELLLLAVYKAYNANFDTFQNSNQRNTFFIRVIGLVQSVLSPEIAKHFCEGVSFFYKSLQISDRAASLKLFHGEFFYRASRESFAGQGFEFLCSIGRAMISDGGMNWIIASLLERSMKMKRADFWNIARQSRHELGDNFIPRLT